MSSLIAKYFFDFLLISTDDDLHIKGLDGLFNDQPRCLKTERLRDLSVRSRVRFGGWRKAQDLGRNNLNRLRGWRQRWIEIGFKRWRHWFRSHWFVRHHWSSNGFIFVLQFKVIVTIYCFVWNFCRLNVGRVFGVFPHVVAPSNSGFKLKKSFW